MLILTRKPNESIILTISDDIDPATPIGDILSKPIELTVLGIKGNQVRIGLDAPAEITILREEIAEIL